MLTSNPLIFQYVHGFSLKPVEYFWITFLITITLLALCRDSWAQKLEHSSWQCQDCGANTATAVENKEVNEKAGNTLGVTLVCHLLVAWSVHVLGQSSSAESCSEGLLAVCWSDLFLWLWPSCRHRPTLMTVCFRTLISHKPSAAGDLSWKSNAPNVPACLLEPTCTWMCSTWAENIVHVHTSLLVFISLVPDLTQSGRGWNNTRKVGHTIFPAAQLNTRIAKNLPR